MAWKQTRPGYYQRTYSNNELFFKLTSELVPGRNNWAVWVTGRLQFSALSSKTIIQDLRHAWKRLRFEQPLIAAEDHRLHLSYPLVDAAGLDAWAAKTFHVEGCTTVDGFMAQPPNTRHSTLHYLPQSQEILLVAPHTILEGPGLLITFNNLIHFLTDDAPVPGFGEEWTRLPLSCDELGGFQQRPMEEVEAILKGILGIKDKGEETNTSPATCNHKASASPPMATAVRRLRFSYDEPTSFAILAACKTHDFSFTAAIHAALFLTGQSHPDFSSPGRNYTNVVPVNYRPYLPPPHNNPANHPIGLFIVGLPFAVPKSNFIETAKALTDIYRNPIKHGAGPVIDMWLAWGKMLQDNLVDVKDEDKDEAMRRDMVLPGISSLGVFERFVQPQVCGKKHEIEVMDLDVGIMQLTHGLILYPSSFRGKMRLIANYNEAFWENRTVQSFMERVERVLFEGLGLNTGGLAQHMT